MLYTGHFYNIDNNKFTVKIITNNDSSVTKTVTLGTPPFVSSVEGDNNIYTPVKYGLATIKILTSDYNFDIYSSVAQGSKVELLDESGNIKWIGYTTPNLYTQGYENEVEELEIECVDALATLKHIKYTTLGDKMDVVCLRDVINHILAQCGVYQDFFMTNATQYDSSANYHLLQHLYISEKNFFDEDNEAMKLSEVLEQICTYLSLTCVANGATVYFLDYDAIKTNNNGYYWYKINNSTPNLTTRTSSHAIKGEDYAENGATLSLGETFNRAKVRCSLYSFESIIPSIWDDKYLTNYMGDWGEMQIKQAGDPKDGGYYYLFYKWLKNDNYQSYYYTKSSLTFTGNTIPAPTDSQDWYTRVQNYVGATIIQADFKEVPNFDTLSDSFNRINLSNYVLIHNHDTNPVGAFNLDEDNGKPVFETNITNFTNVYPALFGGDNMYIIISGAIRFMDRDGWMYYPNNYGRDRDNFNPDRLWIKCKLQFGNQFWDGENWTTTDTCFKLPFWDSGSTEHCVNVEFPIRNNIKWTQGLDATGYAIPLPENMSIATTPKFTMFQPHRIDPSYECHAVFVSDFDIFAKVGGKDKNSIKESDETDIIYENIIDENFVEDGDTVELKICTWANKEPNYSCVGFKRNSEYYQFLNTVYNKGTKQTLIPEEQIIYKLVSQHSKPSVILELALKNTLQPYTLLSDKYMPDRTFVMSSWSIDWEMNRIDVKIIEKQ